MNDSRYWRAFEGFLWASTATATAPATAVPAATFAAVEVELSDFSLSWSHVLCDCSKSDVDWESFSEFCSFDWIVESKSEFLSFFLQILDFFWTY